MFSEHFPRIAKICEDNQSLQGWTNDVSIIQQLTHVSTAERLPVRSYSNDNLKKQHVKINITCEDILFAHHSSPGISLVFI